MLKCFPNYSFKKAIKIVLDNKNDPDVKELVLQLLNYFVNTTDNTIDNDLVEIIRKNLYPEEVLPRP